MLSSIHPLGERARNGSWPAAVLSFAIGSVTAASMTGGGLGWLGSALPASGSVRAAALGVVLLVAGGLELVGVAVPSSHRQVNERWIGTYRSWVYGGGFGLQLGAGFLTYVVTWGVPAVLVAEFLVGDPLLGSLVGAVFGMGRAVLLVAGRFIDRPSRLGLFTSTLAGWAAPAARAHRVGLAALGTSLLLGGGWGW